METGLERMMPIKLSLLLLLARASFDVVRSHRATT